MSDNMRAADLSTAIRVMTAWADADTEPAFIAEQVSTIVYQESADEHKAMVGLISGLSNLCGLLLIEIERQTGDSPHQTLQSTALLIQSTE
jgi:hypothetical protein